ncbi:MAG: site-specific DNA-methyltransferase [Methylacidiphilales bacterium]|nr:site-specific DNA-methyltransferase [Candidatus Methylacidiphilales bacterium]
MKIENTTNNIQALNKNLEVLKINYPHCFNKNGDFDFEKFKNELSNHDINFSKESYGMDWLGKSYARLLATDPAKTLIKEDKDWNSKEANIKSNNLLIKGDNLEVLKHLSNAYHEKIKLIYIDPPYNTGSDGFVYKDDRKFTIEQFSELAGIDEEQAKKVLSFVNSKSNSHSAWLTFMYPRLYIAKQLLKDDGVIFVSIDDNEVAQLRILMDEIFGEENYVGHIVWQGLDTIKNDADYFSKNNEFILCYSKYKDKLIINGFARTENHNKVYKNNDNDPNGDYLLTPLNAKSGTDGANYKYYFKNGVVYEPPKGTFPRYSKESLKELEDKNQIYFGKDNNSIPQKKTYLKDVSEYIKLTTFWNYKFAGSTRQSNQEISILLSKGVFQNPKPTKLLNIIINSVTDVNDLILDFFAGSGTTGDAVMQLNAEDCANGKEGNRKYILVQLPELIDPNKNKTAFDFVKNELGIAEPTIFDITKERLIRAGKKILDENVDQSAKSEKIKCEGCDGFEGEHCPACKGEFTIKIDAKKAVDLSGIDFGFKIYETMPIWEDYEFVAKEFDPQTKLFDESKLSSEDLQILLTTWKTYDNILLTESLESVVLDGYTGYYGNGRLYLMNKGFETKHLKSLLNKIDEDSVFNPVSIIVFGYNFESKVLREIAENVSNYANKKKLDIDFITRY